MAQPGQPASVDTTYLDDTVRQIRVNDPAVVPDLNQLGYAVGVGAQFRMLSTGDAAQDEINATRLRVAAQVLSAEANLADVLDELGFLFRLENGVFTPPQAQPAPGGLGGLLNGTPPPMAGQPASTPGQTTPAPAASTPPPAPAPAPPKTAAAKLRGKAPSSGTAARNTSRTV